MYHKDHRSNPHAPVAIALVHLVMKRILAVVKKYIAHRTSATSAKRRQSWWASLCLLRLVATTAGHGPCARMVRG